MNKLRTAKYLKTVNDAATLGECIAEVAFAGRSNAGKSSILNMVCENKKLARISQRPGQTRAINVFVIGNKRWLVDLPGYGFAHGSKDEITSWQGMIEGYILGRPSLREVYLLVDGNVGATKLDIQMAGWLDFNNISYCVVANKCDKISAPEQVACRNAIALALRKKPGEIRWVSAKKGTGIRGLQIAIAATLKL